MNLIKQKSGALEIYDSARGLKEIAVSQGAEAHFARARDLAGMIDAVTEKLRAQADYIRWHDSLRLHGGDRKSSSRQRDLEPDGAPNKDILHRWRKMAKDLTGATEKAIERCRAICEGISPDGKSVQQSLSNEHYTPAQYIEAARAVLGTIDLDPASCEEANQIVKAERFFDEKLDGLRRDWNGNVWLNPPYGELVGPFITKLMEELGRGVIAAVVLVNAHCTDTHWFRSLWSGQLCFTDHRINFYGDEKRSGSTHGSVFAYFGDNKQGFFDNFKKFGPIVMRVLL